jgi:uncharacterized membrane protein (UPF0136 family)
MTGGQGEIPALVITVLLDVVFVIRLAKTKKFMPSGVLLLLVGATQAILAFAMFGGK